MAAPKIFVSSTCYDLAVIRTELRAFIESFGFEPVMSEYSDILFDYRAHTHSSCLQEVSYCDMAILIIGSRFGGTSVPAALNLVDLESLKDKGLSKELLKEKENLSITQLEYLKGIETGIPIFPFISMGVMNDHYTWERNKDNVSVDKIIYPNIDKQETAKYIFEFINYIRLQHEGNSIVPFSKLDDIKMHLRKQWAALFQRLLKEQRDKSFGEKQINYLSEQIADLKTAIVTSIPSTELGNTARGAIKYRTLITFLYSIYLGNNSIVEVLTKNIDWDDLLVSLGLLGIVNISHLQEKGLSLIILLDNTYFETRYYYRSFEEFARKWSEFRILNEASKIAIINAIVDDADGKTNFSVVKHRNDNFFEVHKRDCDEENLVNIRVIWKKKGMDFEKLLGYGERPNENYSNYINYM